MTTQEPTFADALEQLRISHGLTPAKLARELDEYEGNVSRWRRGGGIEVAKVRKIADYFHVSRGWLEGLAGYPESRDDSSVAVDPDKLERITLVEQVSPEDWPSVRKMLLGLAIRPTPRGLSTGHSDGASTSRSGGRRVLDGRGRPLGDQGSEGSLPTVHAHRNAPLANVFATVKRWLEPSTSWGRLETAR